MNSQITSTTSPLNSKEVSRLAPEGIVSLPPEERPLTLSEAQALLEKLRDVPTTTLFVSRKDWVLHTYSEVVIVLQNHITQMPDQQLANTLRAELTAITTQQNEKGMQMSTLSPQLQEIFRQHFIGRCELGIHPDPAAPKDHDKKIYFFHRIEVDLSEYTVKPGIPSHQYFLQFMEKWLGVRMLPQVATFRSGPEFTANFANFDPVRVHISLN